jgi:acyl carrier protein
MIIAAATPLYAGSAVASVTQRVSQKLDTATQLKQLILEVIRVDPAKIVPKARFLQDLGTDSLDSVELVMAIEEKFDIAIADEDVESLQTVGQTVAYIDKRRQQR